MVHNTFYLPRGLGGHPGARRVATIYVMIPEMLPQTRRRMDFLTEKHKYVQRADHVVCISESTRNDLLKAYTDIHAPVTIAYPGVGSQFNPADFEGSWHHLAERNSKLPSLRTVPSLATRFRKLSETLKWNWQTYTQIR